MGCLSTECMLQAGFINPDGYLHAFMLAEIAQIVENEVHRLV